jgi:hypothetical protein
MMTLNVLKLMACQSRRLLLVVVALFVFGALGTVWAAERAANVPLLSDAEAWKRMPATVSGGNQPLPSWARAVAGRMPRTAAAMLQLDLAQRTKSPVDPVLRAKMRWVIAHANHCD